MFSSRSAARLLAVTLMLTLIGCDKDKRLAAMAERHLAQQTEQNRNASQLHREVAAGSKRLVEADAQSRKEIATLHREMHAERVEVGRQRDVLDRERQDLAAQRRWDSLVAAALYDMGWLLGCLLPVAVCWLLLSRREEPADDQAVARLLLDDVIAEHPILLPRRKRQRIGLSAARAGLPSVDPADPA
ncbi:MAG: hypothetical protein KDB14_26200 [Planctomycetales bacterium]|nr:hypothetical protein [Planctomycetales bacterium]